MLIYIVVFISKIMIYYKIIFNWFIFGPPFIRLSSHAMGSQTFLLMCN